MGAGGGICAKERDELLRPGFNGAGGGKPFDAGAVWTTAGATATGTAAAAAGFFRLFFKLTAG